MRETIEEGRQLELPGSDDTAQPNPEHTSGDDNGQPDQQHASGDDGGAGNSGDDFNSTIILSLSYLFRFQELLYFHGVIVFLSPHLLFQIGIKKLYSGNSDWYTVRDSYTLL